MRGRAFFLFLIIPINILFAQADTSITFSEVMFIPQSGNNEFIEIYNLSETESIDLNGYKIKYSTSNSDVITSAGGGTLLQPRSFAVIFEGDYDPVSGIYNSIVPANTLVLKISDNAFGSSGMANTSDRQLWLINSSNDTLETYTYSADNTAAISDEKIELNKNNSAGNWMNALNTNGTPGAVNSVTPLNYDLEFSSITVNPLYPISGDDIQITCTVKNKGIKNAVNYLVEVFNDINFDSTGSPSELIYSQQFSNLQTGDSLNIITFMNSAEEGKYQLAGKVTFINDEDTLNNKIIKLFTVYPPGNNYNDVVVNEIMYAPSSGEPEWVELFNRTADPVNIKGWKFSDNSSEIVITSDDIIIEGNSFLVLSRDSSINLYYSIPAEIIFLNLPALNNTGDAVAIKDSIGILIDSLTYSPEWGGSSGGRSLERISAENNSNLPSNWGTSQNINKATPGYINSLTPKDYDIMISSFKTETGFGIIGEDVSISVTINNKGLNTSDNFALKIFHDINADSIPQSSELSAELFHNSLMSGDSTILSYITSDFSEGENYFIAYSDMVSDQDTTNNIAFTKVYGVSVNEIRNDVIINEIMHSPSSPRPEWIELYNRSTKTINIKNYLIADGGDTAKVIDENVILNPGEYFIIANDSIQKYFNVLSGTAVKNFPSLNNAGDKLILLDSLYRVIDSLQYTSAWGGNNGYSLERINPEANSTDSINWKTSVNRYKATPGYINSVTEKDYDVELVKILFSPPLPVFGDDVSVSIRVKNKGRNNSGFNIQFFEDTNIDSIPDILIKEINSITLPPGDSLDLPLNYIVQNLQGGKAFFAMVNFISDEDTSNNYIYAGLKPGYANSTIIINEIMFTPAGGEPEWIEIYNTSADSINLNNWSISDVFTTPVVSRINKEIFISGNSYFVLTNDSSVYNYHRIIPSGVIQFNLPSFNNDNDGVVLKDDRGAVIDSVFYSGEWGGTGGYSLERRDVNAISNLSANWGSSADIEQSTPGRINSLTPKEHDLSVIEIGFDPRFPAAGENVYISALIRNNGSLTAENFSVEFYFDSDSNNTAEYLLEKLDGFILSPGDTLPVKTSSFLENLQFKTLTAVKIIYNDDEDSLNNYFEKIVQPGFSPLSVLINEVMYSPGENEPEWFEIINTGGDSINIKNWSVSDILPNPVKNFLTNDNYFIGPGEYIIVSRDTSIKNIYPDLSSKIITVNFGTLSSTTDGIIIYDFRDGIIDSLKYKSVWGGRNGYSLERISLTVSTNDSSNWVTSLSKSRGTPGKINSIATVPDYKREEFVINEIMYDPDIDNSEFIEFINLSDSSVNVGGWLIEDENQNFFRLSDTSLFIDPGSFFLLIADSLTLHKYDLNNYSNKNITNSSTLGLVNTGELIFLKDAKRNVIDSVWFSDKWHNKNFLVTKNKSLERINPAVNGNDKLNWSTSVNPEGATPGNKNSIFTDNKNKKTKISVSPNPFSPDNDGHEDFSLINYNLTQTVSQVRIKIFDSKGRLVRTLLNNHASASSGSVVFDGLEDDGKALRIGIYIIFMEALNENDGVVETLKTTVVIARKLN